MNRQWRRGEATNLERMVADAARETHQLVQPLSFDDTVTVNVNVDTVIGARSIAIDQDLELHRFAIWGVPWNRMQLPHMETVRDRSFRLRGNSVLCPDAPISPEVPTD